MKLMHLKNSIYAISVFLTVSLAVVGCHTRKQSTVTVPEVITEVKSVSNARAELITLSRDYGSWQNARLPMTIRLRSPKQISINGVVTMERGKSILMSLRFLGMEIAVVYITPDSILAMDKYNKRYVREALAQFLGGVPVTLSNVQDLLMGRAFTLGTNDLVADNLPTADFDLLDNGAGWVYAPSGSLKSLSYGFTFTAPRELLALIIKDDMHSPVACMYGKPDVTPYGPVASAVSVRAIAGKTDIDASIIWNLSKLRWNDDVDLRTVNVPSGYQKIESADVLKMLKAL